MRDQRIIVTGGSSGIGHACARLAVDRGAQVAVIDSLSRPTNFQDEALIVKADVSDESALAAAFREITKQWGMPPTGVINAAGIYRIAESSNLSVMAWNEVISVNLTGSMLVAQASQRAMPSGGSIVLLGSIAAERGDRGEPAAHYAASKGGVTALCRHLAVEWGPLGIRVNAVAPGVIDTPMLRLADDPERLSDYLTSCVPLGRLGQADEVAEACLFLAGTGASYISGAVLAVDGGAGAA